MAPERRNDVFAYQGIQEIDDNLRY